MFLIFSPHCSKESEDDEDDNMQVTKAKHTWTVAATMSIWLLTAVDPKLTQEQKKNSSQIV